MRHGSAEQLDAAAQARRIVNVAVRFIRHRRLETLQEGIALQRNALRRARRAAGQHLDDDARLLAADIGAGDLFKAGPQARALQHGLRLDNRRPRCLQCIKKAGPREVFIDPDHDRQVKPLKVSPQLVFRQHVIDRHHRAVNAHSGQDRRHHVRMVADHHAYPRPFTEIKLSQRSLDGVDRPLQIPPCRPCVMILDHICRWIDFQDAVQKVGEKGHAWGSRQMQRLAAICPLI